ncbi:hypothetical protein GCM10023189_04270 [Nibrella saemangeumensis]|uniref:HTH LytTR-type domain-containing protein n=1 Tax=Nibrella saemangeumensis TaxID=1084526 RepID=A0ABP8ME42_9BACT
MEANRLHQPSASMVRPSFPAGYQRGSHRIAIPHLNRTIMVSVDDIVNLEAESNYSYVFTRDGKRYLVSKTLKELEQVLDERMFVRIHKSYTINLAYVQSGLFNRDRILQLADGREVPISRRRMKEITDLLFHYTQKFVN